MRSRRGPSPRVLGKNIQARSPRFNAAVYRFRAKRTVVRRYVACALAVSCAIAIASTAAAQNFPPPSRTVYKCFEIDGKVTYSDSPCPAAQKIEVEPTRGLNKQTGKVREGADVRHERQREAFAEAVRPITGMDAKQFDIQSRRMKLALEARRECRWLDSELAALEQDEKHANKDMLKQVQHQLLLLRLRFRDLGC